MRVIVDALGGDNAPEEIVKGALLAAQDGIEILLTGDEERLKPLVGDADNIEIVHAPEEISCDEDPIAAAKQKKKSSLVAGLMMLKEGKADAFVSAGSTGALIGAASLYVRRIPGVRRMALAPVMTFDEMPMLLMDSGANMDCKAEYLVQFAVMGSIYMEKVLGIEKPRVALLNVGVEEAKGNSLTKEAYQLLKDAPINFTGNIESREVLSGSAHVIVSDGFAGNILLKGIEGVANFFSKKLKSMFMANTRTKIAALMVKKEMNQFKKSMSQDGVGGAPMLGADGVVFKAHGNAKANEIHSAIKQAVEFVKCGVNANIKEFINKN